MMMRKSVVFLAIALCTVLTVTNVLLSIRLAGAGPPARPSLQGGAPTVVSYQGQVTVDGAPYDGGAFFKFAVVDAAGTTTYWSNDGTSTGGGQPANGVVLPVSNGLFNVLLGDTTLGNMTQPLNASPFDGTERYLRVWFSTDYITFEQLAPDRRIAAVPYALQAQEAANADTVDGQHADDLDLPAGAMVLGRTEDETTLITAGFSYTGRKLFGNWATKAAMPTGRFALAAAVVDGIVYAVGGESLSTLYETANEAYDPVTDSWTTRASMPTGRRTLAAAALGGMVYAVGGDSSASFHETATEAYDPVTNSWITRAPMPTGRRTLAAVAVDGVVYAIGGWSSTATYETANEAYDPVANSWTSRAPMPTGRRSLAVAVVDGVVYAIGGASSATDYQTANEAYHPAADSWTTREPMPTGRHSLAAAAVDRTVYAIGGYSSATDYETANEAYDPTTDSWDTPLIPVPTGRRRLAAAVVDGVVYAIGGYSSATDYETANEAYTPALYLYSKD